MREVTEIDGLQKGWHDYITYCDTDSAFLKIGKFIDDQGLTKIWQALPEDERIQYIIDISTMISDYVNIHSFERTQLIDFNTPITDYKVNFKQEIVAGSILHVAKKKYMMHILDNEGVRPKDPLKVTGLEVVRSDTPPAIKEMLKVLMLDILLGIDDDELNTKVNDYKEEIKTLLPEEIATGKGCNNLKKFIADDLSCVKGTPMHIKGVANYIRLLREFGIENDYPIINEGEKARIIYVKPNIWGIESIAFQRWPQEFYDHGIEIDYKKMIDKYFTKKIGLLLDPINKMDVLNNDNKALNLFF